MSPTFAGFTSSPCGPSASGRLWIAGLQLTTSHVAHCMKAIQLDLMPQAYAAAARFWVYPILLILVIGTWRGHRRRVAAATGAG